MSTSRSTERSTDVAPAGHARPGTLTLPLVGASTFASGFFLLAVAGRDFGAGVYVLVVGGAIVLTLPVALLSLAVAALESVFGRAWAAGWYRLSIGQRSRRATAARGLRYAGFLWLANGGALWFAAVASQL